MFPKSGRPVWHLLFVLVGVCYFADGQDPSKAGSLLPQEAIVQTNAFCELVKNPELYSGKDVTIRAKYLLGFEWSVLYSEECPGHMIWVESHGLDNTSEQTLKRAYDAAGPTYSLPAYLTVQGTFVSGGHYGHLGGYSYQIVAHKVFSLLKIASATHVLTNPDGSDWRSYGISISTSIDKSWISNLPESVQNGQQGENAVEFRILRDGSVPDDSIKLTSASDTSELDKASLTAIRAAAPFHHFPDNFSQPFMLLCTTFYYNTRLKTAKEENPYFKALFASTVEMGKAYSTMNDSMGGNRVRTDYHHMLVEQDAEITDDLPKQAGDYQFEYLDSRGLAARAKHLRKEFSVLKIQPDKAAGPNVRVSLYWVSYKKRKLNFALSDWSEVALLYDCEKQTYVVSNVRLGGI